MNAKIQALTYPAPSEITLMRLFAFRCNSQALFCGG